MPRAYTEKEEREVGILVAVLVVVVAVSLSSWCTSKSQYYTIMSYEDVNSKTMMAGKKKLREEYCCTY